MDDGKTIDNQDNKESQRENALLDQKTSDKKRHGKALLIGLVALTVLVGAGLAIVGYKNGSPTVSEVVPVTEDAVQPVNLAAAIAITEGSVEHSSDGEGWVTTNGGETVSVGDHIRTGQSSRAVILLDDGSAVRLDENTEIRITTLDTVLSEITLVKGQLYSRVIESESRQYAVVAANERFQALGTAFKIQTTEEVDRLEVYHSKVKVESDELEIEEGNRYDTASKQQSDIDLSELKSDDFVRWNKEKDSSDQKYKDKLGVLTLVEEEVAVASSVTTVQPTIEPSAIAASIDLTGSVVDDGIKLTWANSGIDARDGYKVVFAKNSQSPTYSIDSSLYAGSNATTTTLKKNDGGSYSFRVCAYRAADSSCDSYSNAVTLTAPKVEKEQVVAGAVSATITDDTLFWTYAGTAPHGFKIVLSDSAGPTYPANSIQYVGEQKRESVLPKKADGTYYVRICKHTADTNIAGGCTDYSNELEYVVTSE